jgi:diazepam-binding inhibitor (GABA receptor modulating acyl-CoA-binding protein)
MPSAKYTETYQKVSKMGEKLKAAGKQGPTNDEQLSVCYTSVTHASRQLC